MKTPLQKLLEYESELTHMFDSDARVAMALLYYVRVFLKEEIVKEQPYKDVNRVEVIQHSEPYNGRAYTNYNAKDVEVQLQDDNKTLKVFLK